MSTTKLSTELYYKDGSSDKVYKATVEEHGGGYVVNFAYGRRGNTLITGSKTPIPVTLEQAQKIYYKLVSEKTGKGYIEDTNGKPFSVNTISESRDTRFRPQLLNEIEEADVQKYINDDAWCAQEKFDGRRRGLLINRTGVIGTNRKGQVVALSSELEEDIKMWLPPEIICDLDGEALGEKIMIFDVVRDDLTCKERLDYLRTIFNGSLSNYLKLVPTFWTTGGKQKLYDKLKAENAEGIVFKKTNSFYNPGRPASGGDQLKFKFCATASCMVGKVSDTKRSVSLNVFDDDNNPVNVGNATVYPNQKMPESGDIVEVKYLYFFPGGSLFQPVLLSDTTGDCKRDDINPDDCKLSKLKIKQGEESE